MRVFKKEHHTKKHVFRRVLAVVLVLAMTLSFATMTATAAEKQYNHIDVRVAGTVTIETKVNGVTTGSRTINVTVSGVSATQNGKDVGTFTEKTGTGDEHEWHCTGLKLSTKDTIVVTCTLKGDGINKTYTHTYTEKELEAAVQECPGHSGFDFDISASELSETFTADVGFFAGEGGTLRNSAGSEENSIFYDNILIGSGFPSIPTPKANDGYEFNGWYPCDATGTVPDGAQKVVNFPATVSEDAYYKAIFVAEPETYTVTYTDGVDGVEVFKDQVTTGLLSGAKTPAFNGTPYRDGYTFIKWDPDVADTVTGNATYTAIWEENAPVETYTVTYTDGVDGEEVFKDQVTTGLLSGTKTPAFNGTPYRDGYTFIKWDPDVADTVTGNATYTAIWEKNTIPNPNPDPIIPTHYYTVKWNNYDNTNLETDYCVYYQLPTYDGLTPVKPDDDEFTYEFIGWDKEIVRVTKDEVYTAQFRAIAKEQPVEPGDDDNDKPVTPDKPSDTGNDAEQTTTVPKTGDEQNPTLWIALIAAALAGLGATRKLKKKA